MRSPKCVYTPLGASNHSEGERQEDDYYATDPRAMEDLLKAEPGIFSDKGIPIWECACGGGHLSSVLERNGYKVRKSDITDRIGDGSVEILDFLSLDPRCFEEWPGTIVTNPPYSLCADFMERALGLLLEGGHMCMFLKLQTLEGQDRYERIFRTDPPKRIHVYVRRMGCGKNGDFSGGSAVCYAWFVWEKGWMGDPSIKWIY